MQIVTAEQFVDGLFAALTLEGKKVIDLDDPRLDEQFEKVYDELLGSAEELGIVPDFTIATDPFYGDSTCLRDAILSVRDLRTVALRNPRFVTLDIRLGEATAEQLLNESRIPRQRLQELARKYLAPIAD